ncbi:MAG TPA: permease-like cell division protein FtsX [Patescibacteria group bacterium]
MNSFTTALVQMRRSPYQSLAAILMLSLTFFVGYTFSMFLLGSEKVLQYFETRPQVIAFFEIDTPGQTITQVEQTIRSKSYVTDVKVVSKEQALEIYQQENADDPLLLELVTAQILPASIEVSGTSVEDLAKIKSNLETETSVEEVVLQQDIIDSLSTWTRSIRLLGLASMTILAITSLLIMIIVIGMKVVSKRYAIQIMHVIGATRWFIKSPFLFEGILYGLLGSVMGWSCMLIGFIYLMPWLRNFLGPINVLPVPPVFFVMQLSIGTLVGMMLGAIAGSVAVGRMIKR